MAKAVPLDKVLLSGTEYETDNREVLIIRKIGTNSATIGTLNIDRKPTTQISSTVASIHKVDSNLTGPFSLGELYNVVPPQTKISFTGASGSKFRIIGTKLQLDPGEAVESGLMNRFNAQPKSYYITLEATFSRGVDAAWGPDEENTIITLTPRTIEEYVFDSYVMVSIENVSGGVAEGEWAVRFYLDNVSLEHVYGPSIKPGIDALSMPRPPASTTEQVPFVLADYPIHVPGDHTFQIRVANISGTAKTPPTGASISVTVTAVAKYFSRG